MERVIVTVKECCNNEEFDLELPTDQKIGLLLIDIVQALQGYRPEFIYDPGNITMFSKRNSLELNPEKTLMEEKVYNGDILLMSQT